MTFRERVITKFTGLYLRTFPPINKNENGMIGEIKRFLLIIPINIACGFDEQILVNTLKKFDMVSK